ncbi:sensor histidine kinase [Mesobacillus stamsii]|uniref:Sensor histidine kinase n=1 Tax=Mesobacillus stamsii TaxID=225347 RepID=A0ABU0FVF1_9BACI|nr:PAS domain-containing sensor histidine kinase [Mesobacillus stamsii]MDQ0413337.1 PAS domain S-box-containing protein [Mesobacillus stamsii]
MEEFQLEQKYLKQIFENIQDGIIIMNQERKILLMNPSAERLTGWKIIDKVPYCSFCENRKLKNNENKCYLIENDEVPYFLSEMPAYHGKKINVEMSTALMFHDVKTGEKEYLLVLRDQDRKEMEEEARISKLMIKKLIEAKENEHKRLAQELHDGVGQSLFTISVALQAIESFVAEPRLHTYLGEVRKELDKAMNDVKSYSYQLRPQSLDRLGLVATIESLISTIKLTNKNLQIVFKTNIRDRLSPAIEINLYRVVQEAIHNIIKYAFATKVEIVLERDWEKLSLNISDNGKGFDLATSRNGGLGLKHMSERVNQLNGEFSIDSQIGKGTFIAISIPIGEGGLF